MQGNISSVTFRRIRLRTQLYNTSWWGAGEPVAVSVLPRTKDASVRHPLPQPGALARACPHYAPLNVDSPASPLPRAHHSAQPLFSLITPSRSVWVIALE